MSLMTALLPTAAVIRFSLLTPTDAHLVSFYAFLLMALCPFCANDGPIALLKNAELYAPASGAASRHTCRYAESDYVRRGVQHCDKELEEGSKKELSFLLHDKTPSSFRRARGFAFIESVLFVVLVLIFVLTRDSSLLRRQNAGNFPAQVLDPEQIRWFLLDTQPPCQQPDERLIA